MYHISSSFYTKKARIISVLFDIIIEINLPIEITHTQMFFKIQLLLNI